MRPEASEISRSLEAPPTRTPTRTLKLARTVRVHHLVALLLEDPHPFGDGRVALRVLVEALEPGSGEHVRELLVRELDEEVGQELAPRLADGRVAEGPLQRLLEVPDAPRAVLPDGLALPIRHVDLARVEQRALAEPVTEVVDVEEGLLARLVAGRVLLDRLGRADDPLVVGLGVAVLQQHAQQLQRVAVGARRAARALVDPVQLRPGPALVRLALDLVAGEAPLDGRELVLL